MLPIVAIVVAGCGDRTEIVITVDTTLGVPCAMNRIALEVGDDRSERPLDPHDLPGTFVVLPGDQSVRATVIATRAGDPVASAFGTIAPVDGEARELRFVLDRSCVPGPCAPVARGEFVDLPPPLAHRSCAGVGYAVDDEPIVAVRDACAIAGATHHLRDASDAEEAVALPFGFQLYDREVSTAWLGVNGYVAFEEAATPTRASSVNGAPDFPRPGILPFWDDLRTSGEGICVATSGSAPSRILWITWKRACFGNTLACPAVDVELTFSVGLEETTHRLFIGYLTMRSPDARAQGQFATIGVRDRGGIGCQPAQCIDGTCPDRAACGFTQYASNTPLLAFPTLELAPR